MSIDQIWSNVTTPRCEGGRAWSLALAQRLRPRLPFSLPLLPFHLQDNQAEARYFMGNRFTSTTVIDLYKRGKFVKKLLARSVFSRTSKLGILAGNHRSRVESSANGKFHNYFFWPFPHICRETFFVYAGKLSWYICRERVKRFQEYPTLPSQVLQSSSLLAWQLLLPQGW